MNKKILWVLMLAVISVLVFSIPDYYDKNYPNFTPDQKANYILSMEGSLNLEEARTLLIENKMSANVKRSLGKEYFRETTGAGTFEINNQAEFNLVIKSTDYLETKLTSVAVSQLKLLAKAPNVKGFEILADGKIDVKSDKTSLFDISSNIESVKSFTNGFEVETSSGYINFNQDSNLIRAQRIRYLDSGIEIENPAPAVPCYIKSGSDTLSVETFKDGAILTLTKNPSGRITSINGNAMYKLKAGELGADIAPESIFNIKYDSGNPKYLIQGLADARYGLVKTKSADKNTVVSFEQISNDNMFNMYGAGEVTYADYYKGTAFAEGTINGKFNVDDFEVNTEMAKNDFAFKKDGKDYVYDVVDTATKQFYAVTTDPSKYDNLDPRTTNGLIVDADDLDNNLCVGSLHYRKNDRDYFFKDAKFEKEYDEKTKRLITSEQSTYVWQNPEGFLLDISEGREVYIQTSILSKIIKDDAINQEYHIGGGRGSPFFLKRTLEGYEIYDYDKKDYSGRPLMLYKQDINFKNQKEFQEFIKRLTTE